jgi:hypothetical protein
MSPGGRRRAATGNLLIALVASASALLVAEGVARWRLPPPRYHDAPLQLDAALGFRGIPGYRELASDEHGEFWFELNTQGWRGPELSSAAAPGERPRLAFFGDSFLVGRGLRSEALLPLRVSALLAEHGVAADIFNFAAIDYGTAQQLLVFREVAQELRPDAVVLAFYTGNDIVNNEPALAGITDVSVGDPIRPYLDAPEFLHPRFLHPVRARLRSISRLFATLERRALALLARPKFAWLHSVPRLAGQSERLRARRAPREGLEVLRAHEAGSPWEDAWQRTFGLLHAFRREVEAVGARFLVLVIPLEEQVQRSAKTVAFDWASRRQAGVGLDGILDWNLPETRLAKFFDDAGFEARLLLPALRELAAGDATPYARGRHWNALGHERAGEAVARWWLGSKARASASRDSPALLVPAALQAPRVLDFREAEHARYLGDGWLDWRAAAPDEPGGWRIGPRSMVVLPESDGAVVVRGHVAAAASFPLAIVVEIVGQQPRALRLREPGSFELRVPRREAARPEGNGYSVVLLGQHGPIDTPLRIQELSVESAEQPSPHPEN